MTASLAPPIRLLLPCPAPRKGRAWGDYYFGKSLGAALRRKGFDVRFSFAYKGRHRRVFDFIRRLFLRHEIEFAIRGRALIKPAPGKRRVLWIISQPDALDLAELESYEHVFVASPSFHEKIAQHCKSSSVLLQCTDAHIFVPQRGPRSGKALFVGNRRQYAPRPIVDAALSAGFSVEVWGQGWRDIVPSESYGGAHIENSELATHYGRASLLLNDHVDDMRREGFVSNRVYDGLACATPVLTEEMPGIPEDLRGHLVLYGRFEQAGAKVGETLARSAQDRDADLSVSEHVREKHSFDNRAATIASVFNTLFAQHSAGVLRGPNAH